MGLSPNTRREDHVELHPKELDDEDALLLETQLAGKEGKP